MSVWKVFTEIILYGQAICLVSPSGFSISSDHVMCQNHRRWGDNFKRKGDTKSVNCENDLGKMARVASLFNHCSLSNGVTSSSRLWEPNTFWIGVCSFRVCPPLRRLLLRNIYAGHFGVRPNFWIFKDLIMFAIIFRDAPEWQLIPPILSTPELLH